MTAQVGGVTWPRERKRSFSIAFALNMRTVNLLLLIIAVVSMTARAADYIEITVQLNTKWLSQRSTNHHSVIATSIVGSTDWFISGDFLKNVQFI